MTLATTLARRAIRARPLRSLLTTAAIALCVAVVLGVAVTMGGLDAQSRAAAASAAGASDLDVRVTSGTGLTADDAARLGTLPGVAEAVPLYEKRVVARLGPTDVRGTTVNLLALRGAGVALRPLSLAAGRLPGSGSHSEIVIDEGLAATLAQAGGRAPMQLGDRLQLTTVTGPDWFRIVGFSDGGGLGSFTGTGGFVSEAAMLDQFRLGLRTALVALHLARGAGTAAVAAEVRTSLGGSVTTVDPRADQGSPLGEVQPLLLLLTVLSVVVGAGSAANSVALAASERRRETSLLRGAGASARFVWRVFVLEVAILAVAAVPLGVGAGIGLAAFLQGRVSPADLPPPSLVIGALDVPLAIGVGLLAALGGAAVAAMAAVRRPILAGVRAHQGSDREPLRVLPALLAPLALVAGVTLYLLGDGVAAALGTVLVLAGVLCALPLVGPWTARAIGMVATAFTPNARHASRNLTRRRNRTALTLAGVTVSVSSAFAVSVLAAGAISGGDAWVGQLFSGNVLVRSPVVETDAVASRIASTPGVEQALPLRFLSVASGSTVLGVTTVDTASYETSSALDVVTPARLEALRTIGNGPAVLVPSSLGALHGWQVGSAIPLLTARGAVNFRVAGVVEHSFPAGNGEESLVMDRTEAVHWFGSDATGFDDLDVATTTGVSGAVSGAAAEFGLSAVSVSDIQGSAQRSVQHSLGLLLAVAMVALVIAMLAVVNTLLVNIRQGARELGMLRAVGLDAAGARRLVLTEAAVLAVTGTVLGVATGCALAAGMLRAVATPGFAPSFNFPLAGAIGVAAAVLAGSLVAVLVPAFRASRGSIVAAMRQD